MIKTVVFRVDFPPVAQPRQRYRCFVPYGGVVAELRALATQIPSHTLHSWSGEARRLIELVHAEKRKPKAIGYLPADHPVNAYKDNVRQAWRQREQYVADESWTHPRTGPIAIRLTFVMTRPAAKVWKTRAMPREKDCRKTNDWDNLAKAFCDALIGEAYEDDGQIWRAWVDRVVAAGGEAPHVLAQIEASDSNLFMDHE